MKLQNHFLIAHCSVNFVLKFCFTKQNLGDDLNIQILLKENQNKENKICLGMKFIAAVIKIAPESLNG